MDFGEEVLTIHLMGNWRVDSSPPNFASIEELFDTVGDVRVVAVTTNKVETWDSMLMTYLVKLVHLCRRHKLEFDRSPLPHDLRMLLNLSLAVPEHENAQLDVETKSFLGRVGKATVDRYGEFLEMLVFTGECFASVLRMLAGRTSVRWKDFWLIVQEVGANAIWIVTLVSFLIGLIIAFLGAVILNRFGADVYVSYLIGYGMLRELGALMTGIIIAGRTGAAFAAEIASMKFSEEIDALKTLGIDPIDFIFLPRILALFLMMPLLVLYADVIGVASGMLVSNLMLDVSVPIFLNGMKVAVALPDYLLGIFKGIVFGILVAISGCLRGMQSRGSAEGVGLATTSAVVTGITLVIFFNAIIDWIAAIYDI